MMTVEKRDPDSLDWQLSVHSPHSLPHTTTASIQVAAELIGTTLDDARLAFGDSDYTGFDVGSHATRTLYTVSQCLEKIAPKLRKQIFEYTATLLLFPGSREMLFISINPS